MKKTQYLIISALLFFIILFSLTSCSKEPVRYLSEDFSHLMLDGVKYVRVDIPFEIKTGQTFFGESEQRNVPSFVNKTFVQGYLYTYDAAKRDPFVWWTDDYYDLYDVELSSGKKVKYVSWVGAYYVYSLPEDKQAVESELQNTSWSTDNAYITFEKWGTGEELYTVALSAELSRYIYEKNVDFLSSVSDVKQNMELDASDELFSSLTGEQAYIYIYDDQNNLRRLLFKVDIVDGGKLLLIDDKYMNISYATDVLHTSTENIEHLILPDAYNDEVELIVAELKRMHAERTEEQTD